MYILPELIDDHPAHVETHERPAPLVIDLKMLSRFRTRMATHSLAVNVARMMYDQPYAFDRIARAQGCDDDALQRLALSLFDLYPKPGHAAH